MRHIVDSLALVALLDAGRLVDLGSGGGLPGIPIALARPDIAVTLVERSVRKAAFLNHARAALSIDTLRVYTGGAESATAGDFEQATARAVATGERLAAMAVPWLVEGGKLLLMLAGEQDAAGLPPGFALRREHTYGLPGVSARFRVAVLERQARP